MSEQITTPDALDALAVEWVIEYDEHPTHPGSHVGPFQSTEAADAWAATFARPGWRASYVVAPLYRPDRPSDLAAEIEHRGVIVDAYDVAHHPSAEAPDATHLEIEVEPTGAFVIGQHVRVEADR